MEDREGELQEEGVVKCCREQESEGVFIVGESHVWSLDQRQQVKVFGTSALL